MAKAYLLFVGNNDMLGHSLGSNNHMISNRLWYSTGTKQLQVLDHAEWVLPHHVHRNCLAERFPKSFYKLIWHASTTNTII